MSTIAIIRLLFAIQQLVDRVLEAIEEKAKADKREDLAQAIKDGREAKTTEGKRDAARRIQESFRTRR